MSQRTAFTVCNFITENGPVTTEPLPDGFDRFMVDGFMVHNVEERGSQGGPDGRGNTGSKYKGSRSGEEEMSRQDRRQKEGLDASAQSW